MTLVFGYVALWKGKQSVGVVLKVKMRHIDGAQEAWVFSQIAGSMPLCPGACGGQQCPPASPMDEHGKGSASGQHHPEF